MLAYLLRKTEPKVLCLVVLPVHNLHRILHPRPPVHTSPAHAVTPVSYLLHHLVLLDKVPGLVVILASALDLSAAPYSR